jgi:hypothetical protein
MRSHLSIVGLVGLLAAPACYPFGAQRPVEVPVDVKVGEIEVANNTKQMICAVNLWHQPASMNDSLVRNWLDVPVSGQAYTSIEKKIAPAATWKVSQPAGATYHMIVTGCDGQSWQDEFVLGETGHTVTAL